MKNNTINKIAITFGDNDFYYLFEDTFKMFFKSKMLKDLGTNKYRISFILSHLLPISYLMNQNCFTYNGLNLIGIDEPIDSDDKGFNNMNNYFKLRTEQILLNEEVDEYIKNNDWDNGETFIYDKLNNKFGDLYEFKKVNITNNLLDI